ncbi:MAG: GH116 family glycosyl-hydrolase [Eubacteriales bacterium]
MSDLYKRLLSVFMALTTAVAVLGGTLPGTSAMPKANENNGESEETSYMKIKNLSGPSGVALGGAGVGYYEIDPTGRVTRNCINNIHKSFADSPDGFLVAAYDGSTAVRLQRDGDTVYGMKGYTDSIYTGLWPTVSIDFENSTAGAPDMGFSAYSGVVAQNVKDSSLPVVFYEVVLTNNSDSAKEMSALLTWGDIIGRGIRDTPVQNPTNYDGESSEWHDMDVPATYAKGVTVESSGITYSGVLQYAKDPILPEKATFQNYNNSFMILAETSDDCAVSILKQFDVTDKSALSDYTQSGRLSEYDEDEVPLSPAVKGGSRKTSNGSAVSVLTTVEANSSRTLRFMVSWFMPEITEEQYASMNKMPGCDYNKYYHNSFSTIEELTAYAIGARDGIRDGIAQWQQPLLDSSLPDWLIFKEINSGYTLYTNGVLNKRGNFSVLEGEMGGYGGTMDQKMSSHPFYEKLFPSLNLQENLQFANVTGSNGEIQHFDVHYYHGISDSDPENTVNPTPAGSMIDNTGAWMVQMWNEYAQTGDPSYLNAYYDLMKTSMAFLKTKYAPGTHIPNYNTTYDDYSHPEILIFSGTVWLNMLDIGADWAVLVGDTAQAEEYRSEFALSYTDVNKLYGEHSLSLGLGGYYAFGSDAKYIATDGESGTIRSEVLFSGAMAGQFISRYSGRGDLLPFDSFVSHMNTFLRTSIQGSNDYFAPKVYNLRTGQDMDNAGSRCWPFYLDSYGGMAAIQAGYLEDGLEVLLHTMLVELRQGYMWTQNLWNPGYSTYMTAPVSWFVNDILAGSALNVPEKTITLGPSCPAESGVGIGDRLKVTLYYPKYWAEVNYRPADGVLTYTVLKTFYEEDETPIAIDTVIASPVGKASQEAKVLSLEKDFIITAGAVLDLSAHTDDFTGNIREKLLTPVDEYVTPTPGKIANGSGLQATVNYGDSQTQSFTAEEVNFRFSNENPPADGVEGSYTLSLSGRILPHYSQKYQLIFEYTGDEGDLTVTFNQKKVTDYSSDPDAVESKQFTPTGGCRLMVYTVELTADTFYSIQIEYKGDLSDGEDVLRFLWWSTTQTMGVVIKERLYPPMQASQWMSGLDFSATTARVEDDHMAYTEMNCYAIYEDIDFGSEGGRRFTLQIKAGAPDNNVSSGGTMEIRLGRPRGTLLGTLEFTPTGDWRRYKTFSADIVSETPLTGLQDICFVFKPTSTFLFNYTDFRFVAVEDEKEPPIVTDTGAEPEVPLTTTSESTVTPSKKPFPVAVGIAAAGAVALIGIVAGVILARK